MYHLILIHINLNLKKTLTYKKRKVFISLDYDDIFKFKLILNQVN